MSELIAYNSERIYWAVEQVEQEAGDINTLHLDDNLFYIKSEVDKVIAELKDKCNMHDFFWEGCGFAKRGFKNAIAVSEAFDNLDVENRTLKRSLWLMTAEWADANGLAACNIAIKLSNKERFFYHDEANREKDIKKYRHRQVVFYRYGEYCRAKAEQCK